MSKSGPCRHVDLIGSPIELSDTPLSYRRSPPTLGEQTDEVLQEVLGLAAGDRAASRKARII
jgi:crotonobetainyl-CoA:carnitine CoA-transferase CaiB-like acyl-CoA transferase